MKRTTKSERAENARLFNTMICQNHVAAIVVERSDSDNPNLIRTRFKACINYGEAVVIAESTLGISGCFIEYFRSIGYNGKQIDYWEDGFCDWIHKEFQYKITYKDGIVIMLECK